MGDARRTNDARLSRRSLLGLAASLLCSTRMSLAGAKATTARRTVRGPRYHVVLWLGGGTDSIYTLDPKTRPEVDGDIDIPYRPGDIVDNGSVHLGPHFAPLAPHLGACSILKGVRLDTANHVTGMAQIVRFRTRTGTRSPTLFDLIGEHREQPLASAMIDAQSPVQHSTGYFGDGAPEFGAGRTLFQLIDDTAPGDYPLLARAARAHAHALGTADDAARVARDHISQVGDLFERLAGVAKFAPQTWSDDNPIAQGMAVRLQRALWLLEHDLARCVFVNVGGGLGWDSHSANVYTQTRMNGAFAGMFARFLGELGTRTNGFGTLADHTFGLVGSEIGRFPRINAAHGKDHFPEAPFLFFGSHVNTRGGKGCVFGKTGKAMDSQLVSLATGNARAGGHAIALDDVGATMLAVSGLDPELYGYSGSVLKFLTA